MRMIRAVAGALVVLVAAAVAFLEATPAPAGQASAVPAASPTASTAKTLTAAECTAERLGATVATSAIGEPVRSVTLSAPSWVEATSGVPAHCRVNGSMAPIDTASTARPINFSVILPASWSRRAAQLGGGGMISRLIVAVAVALMCARGVAFGQWLHYPTADVPRTAEGKVNLSAPAPRFADGKPDFSGIWQPGRKIACTPEFAKFVECGLEIGGSPLALNIGADLRGGLPFQPWAAALVKQRTAENSKDDPHARCLPDNPPRPYGLPHMGTGVAIR